MTQVDKRRIQRRRTRIIARIEEWKAILAEETEPEAKGIAERTLKALTDFIAKGNAK